MSKNWCYYELKMVIWQVARRYRWPIILIVSAIAVGLLYAAPQFFIKKHLDGVGKEFVALQLTHHGDEALGNFARFREIYDGHFPPGEVYLKADGPSLFGPLQFLPLFVAGFIYLFQGDLNAAYLAMNLVIPALLFALFYFLGKTLTGNRTWALALAFFGTLTPAFRALPLAFRSFELLMNNIVNYFIPIVRTPLATLALAKTEDPLLTYLVLLPLMAALIVFWRKPNYRTASLAGFAVGIIYYVYFHYWVFITIIAGLMTAFLLVRHFRDSKSVKVVLSFVGSWWLATVPYWLNFFRFQSLPSAEQITLRFGIETGRSLGFLGGVPAVFDYLFYALLALIVYFVFFKKGQRDTAYLYWIFIAAMGVIWNVQVVTGYVPSPDHWFRAVSPFIFVILAHALYELSKALPYRAVTAGLLICSALLVTKKVVNALVFVDPPPAFVDGQSFNSYAFNPDLVDSWRWINSNLPAEPRIVSPSFVSSFYLYIQTAARPYLISGSGMTTASNELIEERFLASYKLFMTPKQFLRDALSVDYKDMVCVGDCVNEDLHSRLNTKEVVSHLYGGYYINYPGRPKSEGKYRFISMEKAEELISRYAALKVAPSDIEAEYLYYGPWERQISQVNLSMLPGLDRVYKNDSVEIYKILKTDRAD